MDFAYPLTAINTLLISILIFALAGTVGKMRGKHDIKAPAMVGNHEVECAIRVHYNTIEQAIIFLPVLWLFAILVSDTYASIAGLVWLVGRVIYARAYMADPSTRSTGFMISFAAFVVAVLWTLVVAIAAIY